MNIRAHLKDLLDQSLKALQAESLIPPDVEPDVQLDRPAQAEHGDFATNLALVISKSAKMPPRKIAELLVGHLPASELVTKAEVAGPGFINFFLADQWLYASLSQIAEQGSEYGTTDQGKGRRVQVEFVSANPTGQLHVGSGRNAAYGDALARLLEATGHEVHREYYVNDTGKQMERFAESLHARYLQALGRQAEVPEDGYHGEDLAELGRELASARGDALVGRLDDVRVWGVQKILESHRNTLLRFGITFDTWFSEQRLHDEGKVQAAIERLKLEGHVYEKDGALWFKASELGAPRDQVVLRSDQAGTPTYLGVDIAYLLDKKDRGFHKVFYVWGADHHGNLAGLKAGAAAVGLSESVEIILHQMVNFASNGAVARMSKRAGTIVTLDQLLDEVGADAAKFTLLSRSVDVTIDFDMALAKSESAENPVYYVQYQHARACSILRQAAGQEVDLQPAGEAYLSLLTHEAELTLMRKLAEFPELVEEATRLRAPHRTALFCQNLAALFSAFYRDCRVISDDRTLTGARLVLVDCTRQVLANALALLGVGSPEQM